MCGICGSIQVSGPPRPLLELGELDRMSVAMIHRGPDDHGTYRSPGVAIAARRLSIVDVEGGHQPFANEDESVWAIQNGELFNHDALRRDLEQRGHRFRSRCDTEILPHLYEAHGVELADHLRGMFAIAVWDANARRSLVVRDRLGIKPLYYAVVGDQLLFASELKCLLASGLVSVDLDYEAIDAYLSLGFFPAESTPLLAARKLRAGHRIVVDPAGMRVERWWRSPEPVPDQGRSEREWCERVLTELRESVRLRLMSDVPLGAMLSGGLDSSLVVALMAELSTQPVKTFSVGFSGHGRNELDDARQIASMYGTDHRELVVSTDDATDLADLVWHLDEPLADLSALGFIALCGLARQDVTVALSGQGADELFGGYRRHVSALVAGRFAWLPGPIRAALRGIQPYAPRRFRRAARAIGAQDDPARYLALLGNLGAGQRARLVHGGPLALQDGEAALRAIRADLPSASNVLAQTLVLDTRLGLADDMLHYFDRASMAHSLEVRVPFLDHEFVALASTIPESLKVRDGVTKYLLKEAARGLVPDALIDKPKVGFFNAEVGRWLGSQAGRKASDVLLDPAARIMELVDAGEVARMLATQREGRDESNRHVLLALLMLELWFSTYLPRALS